MDKGLVVEGHFLMVAAANSPQYGFGCTIAPTAKLDDGMLDVVCVPTLGPWTFLRNLARLFKKKALVGAQFHRTKRVFIESMEPRDLAVHMDGEPGGTTPVDIRVLPGGLLTLVP